MSLIQLKRAANILGLDSLPGLLPVGHIATLQTHDDPIPDSFTCTQANLRRWGRAGLWGDTMRADIEAGGLPYTTTTERKMASPPRDVEPNPCGFGDHPAWATRDGVRLAYTVEAVYQDTTTHHIAAPDFARWLAAQGEQPSRLIAAWFKSQGVNTATEIQSAPPPAAPQPAAHQPDAHPPVAAKPATPQSVKKNRRDLLQICIDEAVSECGTDSGKVFLKLREWASEKPPRQPLRGVTEKGIQWVNTNDDAKELNLEALRKRVKSRC